MAFCYSNVSTSTTADAPLFLNDTSSGWNVSYGANPPQRRVLPKPVPPRTCPLRRVITGHACCPPAPTDVRPEVRAARLRAMRV